MGWLRRRRRDDDIPGPRPDNPDPVLNQLSVDDAARLVALARQSFAEAGRETIYDGAGALVGDGHTHGLTNLAGTLAQTSRAAWPHAVHRHVETMLAAERTPEPANLAEAAALLYPKLRAREDLPGPAPAYAEESLPGLLTVAALDYPTHVAELLTDERIATLGGWPAIHAVALANLRGLPRPSVRDISADRDRDDATVHALMSEDFFGASRVLLMHELLAGIGIEAPRHGVLFAIPTRHLAALHVPRGPGVLAALNLLVRLAQTEYESGPGSLSRHVYYRCADGSTQQITSYDDDAERVEVTVDGRLHDVFVGLGLLTE